MSKNATQPSGVATEIRHLDPPARLLCGPGPSNVSASVLEAMRAPILGHLDPDFRVIMNEVVELLREVFRRGEGGAVFPLSGTGHAGMQAGISGLIEPGERAVVGVAGFFGSRIAEMVTRAGGQVLPVEVEWGRHVPVERLIEAHRRHADARVLAVVQAETSTGMRQPLEELGGYLAETETLFVVDCVTSLGGIELEVETWGIDYAYSCSQKCLGAPPGMSPVALSDRALERIHTRKEPPGFYLDLAELARHWSDLYYHHTTPILSVYALHEALRETVGEGLGLRWQRHEDAGEHLRKLLGGRGFEFFTEDGYRLPQLTAVAVPEGLNAKEVQQRLLLEQGVEIGAGLGPAAGKIWRVGLMGTNATRETAERVVTALDAVLAG